MQPSEIQPSGDAPDGREEPRAEWQTPKVSRMRAGAAELGFDNIVLDDVFSYS